jgi:hypothetical protein
VLVTIAVAVAVTVTFNLITVTVHDAICWYGKQRSPLDFDRCLPIAVAIRCRVPLLQSHLTVAVAVAVYDRCLIAVTIAGTIALFDLLLRSLGTVRCYDRCTIRCYRSLFAITVTDPLLPVTVT